MRLLLFWLRSLSGFHFLQDKAYSPQDGKPGPSEPASAPPLISSHARQKDTRSYLSFTLCFCCCCFVFPFPEWPFSSWRFHLVKNQEGTVSFRTFSSDCQFGLGVCSFSVLQSTLCVRIYLFVTFSWMRSFVEGGIVFVLLIPVSLVPSQKL